MKKNGSQEEQIKELKKKGNVVLKQVQRLCKRRFRDDFKRMMMLFKYLVLGIITYGEIWGWKEKEELERIQKRYIKWTLNLDSCTPYYVVYKDVQRCRENRDDGRQGSKVWRKSDKIKLQKTCNRMRERERKRRK